VLVVGALLAVGGAVAWWARPQPAVAAAPPAMPAPALASRSTPGVADKSVAVLPFENLSRDPENAYFVAGMQDLILTNLSKLGELKVISRTSTEQYASRPARLSQIARELGVATVLEGSVQRSGNEVMINLQLVDAHTDTHLWAETYRRDLAHIFEVEEEIAGKVADALRARLTAEESASLAARPTRDAEALDWFLRAEQNHHVGFRDQDVPAMVTAVGQYRRALARDPGFTEAWARLATCLTNIYWRGGAPGMDERHVAAQAREAVAKALAQAPDQPEANLASAWVRYRLDNDYAGAIAAFDAVLRKRPGNTAALIGRGTALRRNGKVVDALADFDAAARLSPRDGELMAERAVTLWMLRRTVGAEAAFRQALTLDASNAYARTLLGDLLLDRDGDPAAVLALLEGSDGQFVEGRIRALSYAGRPRDGLALLRASPAPDGTPYARGMRALSEAFLLDAAGDAGGVRQAVARADRDLALAIGSLEQPQFLARAWGGVAMSAALQGQQARALDALAQSRRAMSKRADGDALNALRNVGNEISVDLMLGRLDPALARLAALRRNPAAGQEMSAAVLRMQPRLRHVRKDPRFQQEIRAWEAMERAAIRRECEGTASVQDSPVCRRHSAA
jgi:TolB-like protein/cytochrome c-type biogenesis protein CcmH/NrfG